MLVTWVVQGELSKPGEALDDDARAFIAEMYGRTVDMVGERAFEEALMVVMERSKFRPDIAEIRDVLGLNGDPVVKAAHIGLENVLEAIRLHGIDMKPILGEIVRERDDEGRLLLVPERSDSVLPPVWTLPIHHSLLQFGYGNVRTAYAMLSEHPAIDPHNGPLLLKAKQVEDRWVACYRDSVGTA